MIIEELNEVLENFIVFLIDETKVENLLLKISTPEISPDLKSGIEYIKNLKAKVKNENNNLILHYEEYLMIEKTEEFLKHIFPLLKNPKLLDYTNFIENYYKFKLALKDKIYIDKYHELSIKDKNLFQKTTYQNYKNYIEKEIGNYNNFKIENYKNYILSKMEG
jgi:hypothetical protein